MKETMKNNVIKILAIAVILMGLFIGGFVLGRNNSASSEPTITSATVAAAINEIGELSTVEYAYTNVGKYEDYKEFYGWKVPLTTNRFIITYDGVIKAGIEVREIKVEIKEKEVFISLPEAKIFSHTIDYDSMAVIDELHSIFYNIKITEYNQFYADQAKSMEARAIERGFLKQAQKQAEIILEACLKTYLPEDYAVVFR